MFSFFYHCQDIYRTWLLIWLTRWVSFKKQELLTLREHPSSPPVFLMGSESPPFHKFSVLFLFCLSLFCVLCPILSVSLEFAPCFKLWGSFCTFCPLCVITFYVPCCDVRYDFHIYTMFGSSFPPAVCRRTHVLLCCLGLSVEHCHVHHSVLSFFLTFLVPCCVT